MGIETKMEKPEKIVGRHAKIEETKRERHRKGRGIREGGQRKMVGGGGAKEEIEKDWYCLDCCKICSDWTKVAAPLSDMAPSPYIQYIRRNIYT